MKNAGDGVKPAERPCRREPEALGLRGGLSLSRRNPSGGAATDLLAHDTLAGDLVSAARAAPAMLEQPRPRKALVIGADLDGAGQHRADGAPE
jgi:hypothetical protein